MRIFLPFLIAVTFVCPAFSSGKTDSLLAVLKTELAKEKAYDNQKELRIVALKQQLATVQQNDYNTQYTLCSKLYEEYKVFQFDSAYVYTQKLINISQQTKNAAHLNESRIKVGFLLLSSGMFKETFECLNSVNTAVLDNENKLQYYSIKSRAFSDLAQYNNDKTYAPFDQSEAVKYIDSAIAIAKAGSFDRLYHLGNKQVITGDLQVPSVYYITLLAKYQLTEHQRAMVATGLSFFYSAPGQAGERTELMAIGAINDIRSSTKETLASFELGQQLYKEGNLKDAYTFIQNAMDNAQFYGARLRKIQIGAVLPIIANQQILVSENEKNRFLIYALSIGVIAIIVSLVSFIVFIQLRRVKDKERIIEEKNGLLEKINNKLEEDTHIKEEYIGYFFNVISGYILKLERLKRNVERKIATKKYEDILLSVNEINIKKERETLFYTFDHVFLKIFPNFISSFNSMFKKEDQIWPRDHEVLNTDLRIFALMRLGINDNETIANILEYSVNTIYVYKMRIKAKALVPGDQFDHKIMEIKAVDGLSRS
ncbi:MAG TPA: DUF6377 domain-containing protein [Mucilaginibacter sp.]|jgi:hypothetical protein|nr:DUF6377 domain-containing protein [Mucilaginibacter sp.]